MVQINNMKHTLPCYGGKYGIDNFLLMKRNPLKFLVSAHQKCGQSLSMKCGPYKIVSITNPAHIRYVLKEKPDIYTKKTPGYKGMRDYLGAGLLTNPGGSEWRNNSKLLRPLFWPNRIKNTDQIISHWVKLYKEEVYVSASSNQSINLTSLFRRLTLSILCDIMFGYTDKDGIYTISSDIDICIHVAFSKLYDPLYWINPRNIKLEKGFREARRRLYQFSDTLLDQTPSLHRGTDLGVYMQSILDASSHTRAMCRDEIITLLQAGHETSSTALNAIFYRILSDDSLQASLHQSIDQLSPGDRYSVDNLDLINKCIWESFRFDPSTWAFDRYAVKDDLICGEIPIKQGNFVVISPYVLHRFFSSFFDQNNFNPKANFQGLDDLKKSEYIPFSVGPRVCPGALMAHKEIREVVIGMFENFHFHKANTNELSFKPSITLKLSGDLECRPVLRATTDSTIPEVDATCSYA